jgi:FkbM family methyltransferase
VSSCNIKIRIFIYVEPFANKSSIVIVLSLLISSSINLTSLGGNIGGVSEVISKTINNPKNLVVIEPSDIAVKTLNEISKNNGSFHVYNGALVCNNINLECKLQTGNYFKCEKVNYKVNNNITYEELQNKYNIEFNVLVIDCEGCYEMFLRYGFENKMFDKINIYKKEIEFIIDYN